MNNEGHFAPLPFGGVKSKPLGDVPKNPGRVIGIGAYCELAEQGDKRTQSFDVSEFIVLETGERVWIHHERGFTSGLGHTSQEDETLSSSMTIAELTNDVLTAVLPDEGFGDGEDHPWEWLAELAQARGLTITVDELKRLPYEVVFTDAVEQWIGSE